MWRKGILEELFAHTDSCRGSYLERSIKLVHLSELVAQWEVQLCPHRRVWRLLLQCCLQCIQRLKHTPRTHITPQPPPPTHTPTHPHPRTHAHTHTPHKHNTHTHTHTHKSEWFSFSSSLRRHRDFSLRQRTAKLSNKVMSKGMSNKKKLHAIYSSLRRLIEIQ